MYDAATTLSFNEAYLEHFNSAAFVKECTTFKSPANQISAAIIWLIASTKNPSQKSKADINLYNSNASYATVFL